MGANYIIRLDDACPTFQYKKWRRFFDLFNQYSIKPIIAVIPNNKDPKLCCGNGDEIQFWSMVREWQNLGWCIALHGLDHVYINTESGINKITPHSEFVGLPLDVQIERIAQGIKIFEDNGINRPDVFVAPSHSLDANTLKALKINDISIVSDGLYTHPYIYSGLTWIPCQLWWPQEKKYGVWTICYHPETSTDIQIQILERFLKRHHTEFVTIDTILPTSVTFLDKWFKFNFFFKRNKLIVKLLQAVNRNG